MLVITRDLPFALDPCERSVIVYPGKVAAEVLAPEILSSDGLFGGHGPGCPSGPAAGAC